MTERTAGALQRRRLPAHRAAAELDRALGDPLDPAAPVSFDALLESDEREEPPATAFAALREWGFHVHLVPRELGGRLASFDELLALVRVVSRRDLVPATGLGSTLLASIPVWIWGTASQRSWLAALLLEGSAFGCFAMSERDAGSDFRATATTATPTDGGYSLRGEKWMIGNASRCAFAVVLARGRPCRSSSPFPASCRPARSGACPGSGRSASGATTSPAWRSRAAPSRRPPSWSPRAGAWRWR